MVWGASRKGLTWFQDAKFGMFVHWGLYSLLGRGEWVMHNEQIPPKEYEKLVPQFDPVKFDSQEWVALAAEAGQKYMVVTSRHHDGFSMYDTDLSDYKVTNTPFKRDPLAELAEACAASGEVKLGFYVSLLDWHHPAYRYRTESGLAWEDYLDFLHGQVRELCTNYGDVCSFWFDGDWPRQDFDESNAYFQAGGSFEYEQLYGIIRELQPDAIIHNNRHAQPLPGEDVQGFEQDLPGENTAGFNTTEIYELPLEICMTINDNWGIHFEDEKHKSTKQLVHNLVRSASLGGNFLLNVGPTAEGKILPLHARRLREIGDWLEIYGASIYKTRSGQIPATRESASTYKPGLDGGNARHYLHVLEHISDSVQLTDVPHQFDSATTLRDGSPIQLRQQDEMLALTIPESKRDPFDTVIVLDQA